MNKMVWIMLICLAVLLQALGSCSAPVIPHETMADQSCMDCHGLDGVKPYPQGHAKKAFDDDSCTSCHTPQDITESGK